MKLRNVIQTQPLLKTICKMATIILYKRGKLTYLKQKIEGQCVGITKPHWGVYVGMSMKLGITAYSLIVLFN